MRILAAVPLLLLAALPASAQSAASRATTEDGRKVLLYPDGRWKYEPAPTIAGRGRVHARPIGATERIDLPRGAMTLFIDPGKWKQTPSEDPTKPQGSVQLLTYTGSNLFAEYKPEFEDFLNGLTPPPPR